MKIQSSVVVRVIRRVLMCCAVLLCAAQSFAQSYELRPLKGKRLEGEITPIERRGLWGYANEKDKIVIKAIFSQVEPFVEGVARVEFGSKWGILKRDATYLFEPQYDSICPSCFREVSRRPMTKQEAMEEYDLVERT